MKCCLCLIFALITYCVAGQNLVPNPGFETIIKCDSTQSYPNCPPWYSPNGGSPDYYNECGLTIYTQIPSNFSGNQYSRNGKGYAGIINYADPLNPIWWEYLSSRLSDTMIAGNEYCISIYVSFGDYSKYATNCLGILLTEDSLIKFSQHIIDTPQIEYAGEAIIDSINWSKIQGKYLAKGGEKFISIGCFSSDSAISDVDTITGSNVYHSYAYYYIDDVFVGLCSDTAASLAEINKDLYYLGDPVPNPVSGIAKISYKINADQENILIITDVLGRMVFRENLLPQQEQAEIDMRNMNSGIYFYRIISEHNSTITKRIVKID